MSLPCAHRDQWDQERLDRVAKLVKDDRTFAVIAKELGTSRNAIASQVAKLRHAGVLSGTASEHAEKRRAEVLKSGRAKKAELQRAITASKPPKAPRIKEKTKPAPVPVVERPKVVHITGFEAALQSFKAPAGTGIAISDLDSIFQCRMPFECDDGETRYCGQPATDGSWCACHGARVFQSNKRPSADKAFVPRSALSRAREAA